MITDSKYENRLKKMLRYILKARRIKFNVCDTFNFKMEAKDGGVRAWITVFGVFLNYFFMFGFLRCFSVLIDPIIVQYETNYKAASSLPGAICIGFTIMCLCGGPLIQKFGIRKIAFIAGPAVSAAYFLIYFLSNLNFYFLLIPYLIMALAFGLIYLMCLAALKSHFSERLTLAMQVGTMGTPCGQLSTAFILTSLLDNYGYSNGMLFWAGINAHIFLACILLLPPKSKKHEDKLLQSQSIENEKIKSKSLFKSGSYWVYVLQQVTLNVSYMGGTMYIISYATNNLTLSEYKAASILQIQGGVDLVTRIPWGMVADHKSVNRHYLMSFVCLNMAVAIYCFTWSSSYIHLIVIGVYLGLFSGIWGGLTASCLTDITKDLNCEGDYLIGIGLSSGLIGLLSLVMTVVVGAMVDTFKSYTGGFMLSAVMMLVSAILAALISFISSKESKSLRNSSNEEQSTEELET